jgi:hypothetical protein
MDESDNAVGDLVIGRSDMAVDREFVAVLGRVIDDIGHFIDPDWKSRRRL